MSGPDATFNSDGLDYPAEQSHRQKEARTFCWRSSGIAPMAPLITEMCRVAILSIRTHDGRFSPVRFQSGCSGPMAIAKSEADYATEVMKATAKSSESSQHPRIRQGRRFVVLRSVNGNAAWTISPGWNIPLWPEARILPVGENVPVIVDFGLKLQKVESPTAFGQGSNRSTGPLLGKMVAGLQDQHRQTRARRQRGSGRQLQRAALLDFDFDRSHGVSLPAEGQLPGAGVRTDRKRPGRFIDDSLSQRWLDIPSPKA
jgi:hypothetical protein